MPPRPTPDMAALTAAVPRGHAGFWAIIRDRDAAGPWAITDIAGGTNARRDTVADYVRRLTRAGIAVAVGEEPGTGKATPAALYRLTRRPVDAPRIRRDGTESLPTGQEQMWRAIRQLPTFTVPELVHAASTDVVRIAPEAAYTYVRRLHGAGYVVPLDATAAWRTCGWRLKPAMNTGPCPPRVMRTKFVWDDNLRKVMGAAEPAEEVRS